MSGISIINTNASEASDTLPEAVLEDVMENGLLTKMVLIRLCLGRAYMLEAVIQHILQ